MTKANMGKGNTTVNKPVPPLIQNTPKKAPDSGVGYKQESANTNGGKKGK